MPQFLIFRPDASYGRGARGDNLLRFLRIFHGRASARIMCVPDLERNPAPPAAETIFIGVPTRLSARHLARLTFRRAVLFDYTDKAGPDWQDSDESFLRSVSDLYLKPWVEEGWDFGLRWGLLPIRRYPALKWHVRILRSLFRSSYPEICARDHDVSFLGNCTAYMGTGAGTRYHQRIEWMAELHQSGSRFSFWGGLHAPPQLKARLEEQHGDLSHLFYRGGRCPFPTFFRHLLRSKIVLTPTGNARWSYRHYEAIYAGATLVSTDFRPVQTLIPLPVDNMVHVPDRTPLIPRIEAALKLRRERPELARQSIEHLETYLHHGDYHASKPALMDRFLAQLP